MPAIAIIIKLRVRSVRYGNSRQEGRRKKDKTTAEKRAAIFCFEKRRVRLEANELYREFVHFILLETYEMNISNDIDFSWRPSSYRQKKPRIRILAALLTHVIFARMQIFPSFCHSSFSIGPSGRSVPSSRNPLESLNATANPFRGYRKTPNETYTDATKIIAFYLFVLQNYAVSIKYKIFLKVHTHSVKTLDTFFANKYRFTDFS